MKTQKWPLTAAQRDIHCPKWPWRIFRDETQNTCPLLQKNKQSRMTNYYLEENFFFNYLSRKIKWRREKNVQNEGNKTNKPHGSLEIFHFLTRSQNFSDATLSWRNVAILLFKLKFKKKRNIMNFTFKISLSDKL
jgi:hypothetical protein